MGCEAGLMRSLISARSQVAPFLAMQMAELGERHFRKSGTLLALHIGQPSSGAPQLARVAAAEAAMAQGALGYTTASGLPALRERIAQHSKDWYGVDLDRDQVLVTGGASGAFVVAFLACFDVGSRVALASPGYPCYRNDLAALGVEVVDVQVGPETRWAPTPELLSELGQLDGLIIASPANPTGTVIEPVEFERLVRWCDAQNIQVISDEIYHGITYGNVRTASALEFSDRAIVVNSFSKYFGMTGWRLGWLAGPRNVVAACERLQGNLAICAPHISQVAGLAAFDAHEELAENVAAFSRKRTLIVDGLNAAGFSSFAPPDGAFYIYADVADLVPALAVDSLALCRRWLDELDILAAPGLDFDPVRGVRTVRFSFAGPEGVIDEACTRLASWRADLV
jgi:aspartate/methionine/tyrosine aminotransferase